MSKNEAEWPESLGNFEIFPVNEKPEKTYILGDAFFEASHMINSRDKEGIVCTDAEFLFSDFDSNLASYEKDQFFKPLG